MPALRILIVALVAAFILTGCSDDGSDDDGAKGNAPSAAVDAPPKPELPQAATQGSEAGARAFFDFVTTEVIPYLYLSGDTDALESVAGPDCTECQAIISEVKDAYDDGGHLSDPKYTWKINAFDGFGGPDQDLYAYSGLVDVAHQGYTVTDGSGSEEKVGPRSSEELQFFVVWAEDHWRLDVLASEIVVPQDDAS